MVNLLFPGLYFSILLTSLSGSFHCAAMCGGLVTNVSKNRSQDFFYHLGRLIAYVSLGASAGIFGKTLFSSPILRSFQLVTSLSIGLLFCWTAIRVWKNNAFHVNLVPTSILMKLQHWSLRRKWISPAFLVGISSGLLPCGWLHTFIIAAVATQSPYSGGILLLFFWMGTVPALIISRTILQKFSLPLQKYSSRTLALILLALGLSSLVIKSHSILEQNSQASESCPLHPTVSNNILICTPTIMK